MGKIIDLTNFRSGRLLVIGIVGKNSNGIILWNCICNCGKKVKVEGRNIRDKRTLSCGCLKKEILRKRIKNIKNMRFGRLTVLKMLKKKNYMGAYTWLCECDCSKKIIVSGILLRSGGVRSCGCLKESWVACELKKYFETNYDAISEYEICMNPKTGSYLPFDIFIPNKNVFIEVQGEQHYYFSKQWHGTLDNFEYKKSLDKMKKKFAIKNGKFIEIDLRKIKTPEEAISYIESFM